MLSQSRWFNYDQAPLPLKISLPFTLMFMGLWITGGTFLGRYFSEKLDQGQVERATQLSHLIEREVDQRLENLRRSARLLADNDSISQGIEQSDTRMLQQTVLPLKTILGTDAITLMNNQQQVLLDTRRPVLENEVIKDQSVIDLFIAGTDISTLAQTSSSGIPVMLGAAPIKNEQEIIGGIILGTALDEALLLDINHSIEEQIVVIANQRPVASTFPVEEASFPWVEDSIAHRNVIVEGEHFLANPIVVDGLKGDYFEIVLLMAQAPLMRAKQALWAVVWVLASVGVALTAIVGYWIAWRIAKPIRVLTNIARQVVSENNFELQMPVQTQDEIGILSTSFNQLIRWVGQYTDELELSAKTLETRVEERAQELSESIAQLQDTQAQLIQTEKMSSLGQMVAGIAHEINNPINFIQGNLKPLNAYFQDMVDLIGAYEQAYPQPSAEILDLKEAIEVDFLLEDSAKILDSMKMGTQRVRDIIVSLRNFSRLDEATIKDVDLCEGIDSTLLILNHRIKQGVKVITDYGSLPLVTCSPAQLNQVFTNIIANALDAMFEADVTPKELTITTRLLNDEQVQISIRDSGPGMPEAVKARIFDPFFTTKAIGKGTGIGLGICFKIIQQHQGTIVVNSEVGKGTEFLITLPKTAQIVPLEDPSESADTEGPKTAVA
ncbi:MAG: ATP-binding protein [Cyanobacteria bacterium P01_A01_bin.116]